MRRDDGLRRQSRSRPRPTLSTALVPTRKRATSSIGFCVAERPIRSSGAVGHLLEALEAEREVGAAPRADDGVDFVDDHGADRPQHLAAALGRQQQIQRLGRRDQNVRRRAQHRRALGLRRIAGANGGGDARRARCPALRAMPRDAAARFGQVLVDVRAQRLERRHVDDAHFVRQRRTQTFLKQVVERGQKRRERLARSGRRGDQRVAPFTNRCPTAAAARLLAHRTFPQTTAR